MQSRCWFTILLISFASAGADTEKQTKNRADTGTQEAVSLMRGFAEGTELTSDCTAQRYLWTDALAVCNSLGLARMAGEERYNELALRLVDHVHHTLGRHRPDDPRKLD